MKRGITLVEVLIYLAIMSLILAALFSTILSSNKLSTTEEARVKLQQESRYLLSNLTAGIKDSGSVLSISNTSSFLSSPPCFNGIQPLNNGDTNSYSDGIIIAKGDPNAVTKTTTTFNSSSSTSIQVETTERKDIPGTSAWQIGDKGIIINDTGYYIFSVTGVATNTLTIRNSPVYYSGLLSTSYYDDFLDSSDFFGQKGNSINYTTGIPVIKLDYFAIYLMEDGEGQKKNLIKVTDTKGASDPLNSSNVIKGVEASNIFDLQIIYTMRDNDGNIFNYCALDNNKWPNPISEPCSDTSSADCTNFIEAIRNKILREVTIRIIMLSDEYRTDENITQTTTPTIGDMSPKSLIGDFTHRIFTISINPRNYNVLL